MRLLTVLWLLAAVAVVGGAALAVLALVRATVWRFRPLPLRDNRAEARVLAASVAAAVLGSVWLFVGPAYSGFTGTGSMSFNGSTTSTTLSVAESTLSSFYAANGPKVIPLFILPVAFALLPFGLPRWRARPAVQGLCALLLGAQAAIGMSGYGLFFAPSGALMLVAGIMASRKHGA